MILDIIFININSHLLNEQQTNTSGTRYLKKAFMYYDTQAPLKNLT